MPVVKAVLLVLTKVGSNAIFVITQPQTNNNLRVVPQPASTPQPTITEPSHPTPPAHTPHLQKIIHDTTKNITKLTGL